MPNIEGEIAELIDEIRAKGEGLRAIFEAIIDQNNRMNALELRVSRLERKLNHKGGTYERQTYPHQ